ncbi:hypothetical protein [Segatella maculosa]|uniref:hypothetical protein n=1 Tax=Segatella maculosa TaxID=439703 RepID=UPI0023F428EF|nr:hypothetical protein [Segatella maculosa]
MAEISAQYRWDWNARRKSLIINMADTQNRLSECRDARSVRPPTSQLTVAS